MTQLESGFERKLRESLLDDTEEKLIGEQSNLVFEFVELVHTLLEAYGQRHGYHVESTIESLGTPVIDRSDGRVAVTIGWEHEQMDRWEFGVSPHTIDGNPLLSFVWEDPPNWVKEEFPQGRDTEGRFVSGWRVWFSSVDHPGIPESRAIRDSINAFETLLEN